MAKKLIITADDFCGHPYINKGIYKAIDAKAITAVSALMNMPDSQKQVRELFSYLKKNKHNIGIGVHLTLTSGHPVLPSSIATITDKDGSKFMDITGFDFKKIKEKINLVEKECRAQIQVLVDAIGIENLDHISSHHGVLGVFNPLREVYFKLAKEYNVPVRQPGLISKDKSVDNVFKDSRMKTSGIRGGIKNALHEIFDELDGGYKVLKQVQKDVKTKNIKAAVAKAKAEGVFIPDYFFDGFYGFASMLKLQEIFQFFPAIKGQTNTFGEMVTHLGDGNYNLDEEDDYNGISFRYFDIRKHELNILANYDYLTKYSTEYGIDCIKFSEFKSQCKPEA